MTDRITQLRQGMETAFIDAATESNLAYKPQMLVNDAREGQKLLAVIEDELLRCQSFAISVAFITLSGIEPLLQTLKELEKRSVQGRILTTDYLMFSEPEALKKLAGLKNIELRMYVTGEGPGFHTKGYIFEEKGFYRIIVGSANLTQKALTVNQEWNTRIVSTAEGEFARRTMKEFTQLWEDEKTLAFDEFIDKYTVRYAVAKRQREIARKEEIISLESYRLSPNSMQTEFLNNLKKMWNDGVRRALLVSATGTGKTYASAFAMRDVVLPAEQGERMLFLVHREQIARQAMDSFKRVFGSSRSYGLLSGTEKDVDAQFLFATMQTMSKPEVMRQFDPRTFTGIVLDEAHKTGAPSYQRIMSYFDPEIWLGMTASPERMDDFDVFGLFDHNIAYEIRLQQAMEEDLLCPFHYFGITELEIEGETLDDETGFRSFSRLVCDARVDHVIREAEYYGHSGDRLHGLIFCSRKREAEELSAQFNRRGYRTVALGGDDSQEVREEMVERLTGPEGRDALDYIFTVDIFNEGVDLPEINQVILLRPTQSPIIFVQQLGRGLRKDPGTGKEFVVVLDFIGNYKNNFMIPIALSGDRTYNKDNVRRYVTEGARVIPGSSSIHFDEIARKRIFEALDSANFSDIKLIRDNYKNLKYKLGRIPALMDFDRYGEMDVVRIFDNPSLGSYYKFLVKYEPEYKVRLNEHEEKAIEFISRKLASGKRIHEIELLSRMLFYRTGLMSLWKSGMQEKYGISPDALAQDTVVSVLTNNFATGGSKGTYADCIFLEQDGPEEYRVSANFAEMLENPDFAAMLEELLTFARSRYETVYADRYQDTDLVLYQKYTYEDVCRLLNWEKSLVPLNIGGYKFDKRTHTFPVFINYDKAEDIQDTVKYEDHFVSEDRLIAISKSNRTIDSEDVQNFLHAEERGITVELFVRKNKDDKISKEFYYLGRMKASGFVREFIMPNTTSTAVEIEWILDVPVREDLYEYIVNG